MTQALNTEIMNNLPDGVSEEEFNYMTSVARHQLQGELDKMGDREFMTLFAIFGKIAEDKIKDAHSVDEHTGMYL